MSPASRVTLLAPKCRLLWLALVLALGLNSFQTASASVIGANPGAEDEHGKYCHCGPKCSGRSCCCGPKRTKPVEPAPIPDKLPTAEIIETFSASLCMGAAPCGDSGLPTDTASFDSIGKMAAIGISIPISNDPKGRLLAADRRCIRPSSHVLPLDEPPEASTFV